MRCRCLHRDDLPMKGRKVFDNGALGLQRDFRAAATEAAAPTTSDACFHTGASTPKVAKHLPIAGCGKLEDSFLCSPVARCLAAMARQTSGVKAPLCLGISDAPSPPKSNVVDANLYPSRPRNDDNESCTSKRGHCRRTARRARGTCRTRSLRAPSRDRPSS